MIFGGLSEKELIKISELLEQENIKFSTQVDSAMMQTNDQSMRHNLRHLNPPSISTDILAIEIDTNDFESMSESLTAKLLNFGITNKVPEGLDLDNSNPEPIQQELMKGNKRVIGRNFINEIILLILLGVAIFSIKSYF